MKKLYCLLLVMCLAISLSACADAKNAQNDDTTNTQTQINTTNTNSAEQNSGNGSSDAGVPSSTTSTPTTTTKPKTSTPSTTTHTHSYSVATCTAPKKCSCGATNGNALGHKWQYATCKAPKTCSVCKTIEGTKADHIVSGETCKWCKQVVEIDPVNFNANIIYSCIGPKYDGEHFGLPMEYDCYVITFLELNGYSHSQGVCNETDDKNPDENYTMPFHHNGKYYGSIAQWDGITGETSYNITKTEIIVTIRDSYPEKTTIKFKLLSNGTLRVTAVSGSMVHEEDGIKAGAIFYPNLNPYPNQSQ